MKDAARILATLILVTSLGIASPAVLNAQSSPLSNADMEKGEGDKPSGWRFGSWKDNDGNHSIGSWDSTQSSSGRRSLKIVGRNGGWSATMNLEPDSVYRLSFRYRQTGGKGRVVAYVRAAKNGKVDGSQKPLLYSSKATINASQTSGFVGGQFIKAADQNGWVHHKAGSFRVPEDSGAVDLLIKSVGESAENECYLDDVEIERIESTPLPLTASVLIDNKSVLLWTDDTSQKILPTSRPPLEAERDASGISLDLARGEYGAFQIAVNARVRLNGVHWRTCELQNDSSNNNAQTRRSDITVSDRMVENIMVDEPIKPFGLQGLNPDPLTTPLPAQLQAGAQHVYWFTVFVPQSERPGTVTGSVALVGDGETVCEVPLKIRVRDISLPRRPSLDVFARMHASEVKRAERGGDVKTIHRYYESYFSHRVRCSLDARLPIKLNGEIATVNADDLVEHLKFVKKRYGARPFFIPAIWISHEKHCMPVDATWRGRKIFTDATFSKLTPEFERPFEDSLRQIKHRLQAEGLFDEPIIRFIDEPRMDHEPTLAGIRSLASLIKRVLPNVTISLTTTVPDPALFDVIDHWVLHTDAWDRGLAQIEAAREAGNQISVYNNAISYVEQERIRVRLWPWLLKKHKVDGSYSWCGTTNWKGLNRDPWKSGRSYFEVMFYPPRGGRGPNPPERGPIESARWEMFRLGLQDYEYLTLAESLVERLHESGKDDRAEVGRAAIKAALDLVDHWPQVRPPSDRPYCRDVTKLTAARTQLADAIEAMQNELAKK